MKTLICMETGEHSSATDAGAELLLKRGTHEILGQPKAKEKPAPKKRAAASVKDPDEG